MTVQTEGRAPASSQLATDPGSGGTGNRSRYVGPFCAQLTPDLTAELVHGAPDDRDSDERCGVVDEVAGREVVAPVEHEVEIGEEFEGVATSRAWRRPARPRSPASSSVMVSRADATFERPTSAGVWIVWRGRLLDSTASASTTPMVPNPAAARAGMTALPSPPAPTTSNARRTDAPLCFVAESGQRERAGVAFEPRWPTVRAPGSDERSGGTLFFAHGIHAYVRRSADRHRDLVKARRAVGYDIRHLRGLHHAVVHPSPGPGVCGARNRRGHTHFHCRQVSTEIASARSRRSTGRRRPAPARRLTPTCCDQATPATTTSPAFTRRAARRNVDARRQLDRAASPTSRGPSSTRSTWSKRVTSSSTTHFVADT